MSTNLQRDELQNSSEYFMNVVHCRIVDWVGFKVLHQHPYHSFAVVGMSRNQALDKVHVLLYNVRGPIGPGDVEQSINKRLHFWDKQVDVLVHLLKNDEQKWVLKKNKNI